MTQDIALRPRLSEREIDATLDALAKRYRAADGIGMQALGLLGGQAESLIDRLPAPVRRSLTGATERALEGAFDAAARSRSGRIGDGADWLNTVTTTAMGAAGGFGGLPSALAELPVTTTVLLRAIQGIADDMGFDPTSEEVRKHCIAVFASAGPLNHDDDADLGFLSARLALTGASVHALLVRVAPRLATVLGQKLAAQTVPVLGAVAGAATNYAFTSYYQDMARVYFGLLALARDSGQPHDALLAAFRDRVTAPRVTRA